MQKKAHGNHEFFFNTYLSTIESSAPARITTIYPAQPVVILAAVCFRVPAMRQINIIVLFIIVVAVTVIVLPVAGVIIFIAVHALVSSAAGVAIIAALTPAVIFGII